MTETNRPPAKFKIGDLVRHRATLKPGVVIQVDWANESSTAPIKGWWYGLSADLGDSHIGAPEIAIEPHDAILDTDIRKLADAFAKAGREIRFEFVKRTPPPAAQGTVVPRFSVGDWVTVAARIGAWSVLSRRLRQDGYWLYEISGGGDVVGEDFLTLAEPPPVETQG